MKYDSVLDQQSISGKIVSLILCVWKPCYVKSGHIYICIFSSCVVHLCIIYVAISQVFFYNQLATLIELTIDLP